MGNQHDEQHDEQTGTQGGGTEGGTQPTEQVEPPHVEPLTPPPADPDDALVLTPDAQDGLGEPGEASEAAGGIAPTQPGDEGVPFRPSSDFEQAADEDGNLIEGDG